MSKKSIMTLVFSLAVVLAAGSAGAQERCKVKWETPAASTKYVQQHMADVGDVPGHQVGLFELNRTFVDEQPNCHGLKRVQSTTFGYRDFQDRNGHVWGYGVTTYDNGDKHFARFSGTAQTALLADGQRKSTYTGVTNLVGGTGKLAGMRGVVRETTLFDPEKGLNEQKAEGEYWIEK